MLNTESIKALSEEINLQLFRGVVNLVVVTTTVQQNINADQDVGIGILYYNATSRIDVKKEYNITYLGELLERYENLNIHSMRDLRALLLAIAFTKNLIVPQMFVGRQKENFVFKMSKLCEDKFDIYLASGLYFTSNDEIYRNQILKEVTDRKYTNSIDILFALSFDDNEECRRLVFQSLKVQLVSLFGKKRNIDMADNIVLFRYLLEHMRKFISGSKSREYRLFRLLDALAIKRIPEGNKNFEYLVNNGYSEEDVFYLNCFLPKHSTQTNRLKEHSISYEKIVVDFCAAFISSQRVLSHSTYQAIENLLRKYNEFPIKCDGYTTIAKSLKCRIKINNLNTYRWLYYIFKSENSFPLDCHVFHFDMIKGIELDGIYSFLEEEDAIKLINENIYKLKDRKAEEIQKYISKFNTLTSINYIETFEQNNKNEYVFEILIFSNLIEINNYIDKLEYLSTEKPTIISNIHTFVAGINSRQAFEFMKLFIEKYGIMRYEDFFKKTFDNCILIHSDSGYYRNGKYYRDNKLNFIRSFLNEEETLELLTWINNLYYWNKQDKYMEFIKAALEDPNNKKFFSFDYEKIKDILKAIIFVDDLENIERIYLNEDKLLELARKREEQKLSEKQENQKNQKEAFINDFNTNCNDTLESIAKYTRKYIHRSNLSVLAECVIEKLNIMIPDEAFVLSTDALFYLEILSFLFKNECITYQEFIKRISLIEGMEHYTPIRRTEYYED